MVTTITTHAIAIQRNAPGELRKRQRYYSRCRTRKIIPISLILRIQRRNNLSRTAGEPSTPKLKTKSKKLKTKEFHNFPLLR
jgi:hypothetical protein